MKIISFRENVASMHGEVLRSSAIFYLLNNKTTKSTISFLNYWRFKRDIEVSLVASVRDMGGNLLVRMPLIFEKGHVINFSPFENEEFEGSVEIEIFCTQNMAIPYGAIICCYETPKGFTVVHSYGRAYSPQEVQEGRTLSEGREGCWTIRDSEVNQSFCVVHNGFMPYGEQSVYLKVVNHEGRKLESKFVWANLKPFETRKMYPADHLENLSQFLDGKVGHATFDFNLGAGFTRMLVGNERKDGSDLQVTHSNFDYSRQKTDLTEPDMDVCMVIPAMRNLLREVIVYPQMTQGHYTASVGSEKIQDFESGSIVRMNNVKSNTVIFKRNDGLFPSRLVTGFEVQDSPDRMPAECSLGVLHKLQPKKRFWWGLVTPPMIAECILIINDVPLVYGGAPEGTVVVLSLYSSKNKQVLERKWLLDDFRTWENGIVIQDIWPEAFAHLDGDFGYFAMFCEYGGLMVYSLMRNKHGSICLEHGF